MAENVAAACKKMRRFTWLFLPFRLRTELLIYVFQISVQLNQPIVQQPFHYPQIIRLGSAHCYRWHSCRKMHRSVTICSQWASSAQPAVFEGTGGIGHSVTGHSVADKK